MPRLRLGYPGVALPGNANEGRNQETEPVSRLLPSHCRRAQRRYFAFDVICVDAKGASPSTASAQEQ